MNHLSKDAPKALFRTIMAKCYFRKDKTHPIRMGYCIIRRREDTPVNASISWGPRRFPKLARRIVMHENKRKDKTHPIRMGYCIIRRRASFPLVAV